MTLVRDDLNMITLKRSKQLEIEMYKSRDRGWVVMCTYRVHGRHIKTWMSEISDRLTARRVAKMMKKQSRYDFIEIVPVW